MPIGTVKFFNTDKGYGFIANEDGSGDSFVHISAVERAGMATLERDQRLSYELRRIGAANSRPSISSKPERVAKAELLVIEGQIAEILHDGRFRMLLDNAQLIIALSARKMRRCTIASGLGYRRAGGH